jgi:UV DNA damage endonuclease
MAKRKRSTATDASLATTEASNIDSSKVRHTDIPLPPNVAKNAPKATRRQFSREGVAAVTNPDVNPDVLDGKMALRASPDGHETSETSSHLKPDASNGTANGISVIPNGTTDMAPPPKTNGVGAKGAEAAPTAGDAPSGKGKRKKAPAQNIKVEDEDSNVSAVNSIEKNAKEDTGMAGDPEDGEGLEEDEVEVKEALSRPPPVNSEYLPLPWKGRLGYVCSRNATMHTRLTDASGLSQHLSSQFNPPRLQL